MVQHDTHDGSHPCYAERIHSVHGVTVCGSSVERALAEFGLGPTTTENFDLLYVCLIEAIDNVVSHAYPGGPNRGWWLELKQSCNETLTMSVSDEGIGLNGKAAAAWGCAEFESQSRQYASCATPRRRPARGRGLPAMRELAVAIPGACFGVSETEKSSWREPHKTSACEKIPTVRGTRVWWSLPLSAVAR